MNAGQSIIDFSNFIWGTPILILLLGGGLFFLLYSRLAPLRYIRHAIAILAGKYDNPNEPGQINHYQALSTALAGTVGMGNVSGVAVAITMGGPGAVFWMWVSAFLGVATKFFTSTLAVLYRGKDDSGELQGGPMYVIREGLSKRWHFLAGFFAAFAMLGVSPVFQANQLKQVVVDVLLQPVGIEASIMIDLLIGLVIAAIVTVVIIGGIKRIGRVAGRMVPFMVILYLLMVLVILIKNYSEIIPALQLIVTDAFTGKSVLGGAVGAVIITGVRRAAFSNEAGIGTAPMAHGAAKTNEPVREGLVAMLGPIIDTLIVCTITALAIVVTGVWDVEGVSGITLTAEAMEKGIPDIGPYLLIVAVTVFAMTTLFAFPYYGTKSFAYLFGTRYAYIYKILYIMSIPVATVSSLRVIISLVDSAYALMAFPTVISALILAPKARAAAKSYFARYNREKRKKQVGNGKQSS